MGDFKHSIVESYVLLLELVSSMDTETETAGSPRGCIAFVPRDRREPTIWSGQHDNCLQHGNSNAIAVGT